MTSRLGFMRTQSRSASAASGKRPTAPTDPRNGISTVLNEWRTSASAYHQLIQDSEWDSAYLRNKGLIPNVIALVGECRNETILDAGTGTGWLFNHVRPKAAYACDLVVPPHGIDNARFDNQDVNALTYDDGMFDTVVASLLLLYCSDLQRVCSELRRVSKPKGRLVVALMHPYFYRTGEIQEDGSFLLTRDLSQPDRFLFEIAGRVGPFECFYRPFPDYVNTLIHAGWEITELRDWFIDIAEHRALLGSGVKTKIERTGHIPLFTFILCRAA